MSAPVRPVITRRQLLLGALVPIASSWTALHWRHSEADDGVAALLRALFPEPRAAAGMGALYLQSRPEERSIKWLAQTLLGSPAFPRTNRHGRERLTARLRADRERDFVNADLVVLEGWVITRTEARLLALLSLYSPPG